MEFGKKGAWLGKKRARDINLSDLVYVSACDKQAAKIEVTRSR